MPNIINTKVFGVSKKNVDGKSRQRIVKKYVEDYDKLVLVREPENSYDPNAIAVFTEETYNDDYELVSYQIGYLSSELAARLAPLMDAGYEILCQVLQVTGGEEDKEALGVNIELTIYSPEEAQERKLETERRPVAAPLSESASLLSQPSLTAPRSVSKVRMIHIVAVVLGAIMLCLGLVGITGVADQTTLVDKLLYLAITGAFILIGIGLMVPMVRAILRLTHKK